MPWWQSLGTQDGASPLMEQLIFFHDHTMVIITLIVSIVGYIMPSMVYNKFVNRSMLEHQTLEVVWTLLPSVILLFIALPSLRLLYLLDEVQEPSLTFKAIGHQWYWSYEYSDFHKVEFDAYMINTNDLSSGMFRLLEVDSRTTIPNNTQTRVLVTSEDVIHAWTIPSLGVKADAVPGRLNQLSFNALRPGLMYGQCSEICGANHSFMPIVLEVVTMPGFLKWVTSFYARWLKKAEEF